MEKMRKTDEETAIAAFRRRTFPASPPSRGSFINVALFYVIGDPFACVVTPVKSGYFVLGGTGALTPKRRLKYWRVCRRISARISGSGRARNSAGIQRWTSRVSVSTWDNDEGRLPSARPVAIR